MSANNKRPLHAHLIAFKIKSVLLHDHHCFLKRWCSLMQTKTVRRIAHCFSSKIPSSFTPRMCFSKQKHWKKIPVLINWKNPNIPLKDLKLWVFIWRINVKPFPCLLLFWASLNRLSSLHIFKAFFKQWPETISLKMKTGSHELCWPQKTKAWKEAPENHDRNLTALQLFLSDTL